MSSIRMVAFYQGVKVDSHTERSFTPDENVSDRAQHKGWSASVEPNGVLLKTSKSDVLVPFNNVAYIVFNKPKQDEPAPKSSKSK